MLKLLRNICFVSLVFPCAHADKISVPLDKVSLSFSAEQWVKTSTAKLEVSINAVLTNTSLAEMRSKILKNLNTIAKAQWHITQFNRSQDNSGLERLYVNAQARVDQALLANVNDSAKKVSQPGAKYQVANIDFSPSDQDIQSVKNLIRQDLYQKVQSEVAQLNQQFKEQHYSVFRVLIVSPDELANQRPQLQRFAKKNMVLAEAASYGANISVSNKVKLTALVTVASNRKVDNINHDKPSSNNKS